MMRTSALALALAASTAQAADITVTVAGLDAVEGTVNCALFNTAAGFLQNNAALVGLTVPASGAQTTCTFRDQPTGSYAVAVFHDENGNGTLDTNLLGLPKERWGLSRLTGRLFRPPSFDDAAFWVGDVPVNLTITLR